MEGSLEQSARAPYIRAGGMKHDDIVRVAGTALEQLSGPWGGRIKYVLQYQLCLVSSLPAAAACCACACRAIYVLSLEALSGC